ncbi:uncharacterized protein LOC127060799 [Serinus canaria]|uniref:uncharacterized protein LOC127060799 n=1 Tax=Serinus canaria TaxID=9135 RepID=UPI0021CC9D2A|nr:uncharacterized protein LOC127060799 [Serinus canaria]
MGLRTPMDPRPLLQRPGWVSPVPCSRDRSAGSGPACPRAAQIVPGWNRRCPHAQAGPEGQGLLPAPRDRSPHPGTAPRTPGPLPAPRDRSPHPRTAARGSRSSLSLSPQLFQGSSMAVTLSRRVYNPAAALGSLSRAGGQLGSRSAATRRCHSVPVPPSPPPARCGPHGTIGISACIPMERGLEEAERSGTDGQMSLSPPPAPAAPLAALPNLPRG